MTIAGLAKLAIESCESEEVDYMLTGAFATGCYGIPRSTKDVDLVISVVAPGDMERVIARLEPDVEFIGQAQFDTITWGQRQVGQTRKAPFYKIELFKLFDDEFVKAQFGRRVQFPVSVLERNVWIPTAEDVIVQKLRWARDKDLVDATDVLIVQGLDRLDMHYVREWCDKLGISERLAAVLERAT